MAYDVGKNSLRRQEAVGMDRLVDQFIREMKLSSGLKRQRAEEVWNAVSGAGRYTLDVTLNRGVMTCSLSSSVVRNQLYMQRDILLKSMNEALAKDSLFIENGHKEIINTLILR